MNRFSVYAADYVSISDMMADVLHIAMLKKSLVSEIELTKKTYERLFPGEPASTFYEVLFQHKLRKIRINISCKPSDSFVEILLSELPNPSDTPAREESSIKWSELVDKITRDIPPGKFTEQDSDWNAAHQKLSGYRLNTPLEIVNYRIFGVDPNVVVFRD